MFGVTSPRRWAMYLLLGLVSATVLGLTGCGKEEAVDPYVYDSLRRITRGDTLSAGFLFEIDAPEFEYVRGNTGIIRDGNILEFLVAPDLENTYRDLRGTLLGVKKTFTPQPTHLVLKRVKRDGVVVRDSIPRPEHYTLPRLLRAGAIDQEMPGAPIPEIGWQRRDIDEAVATFLPENEGDPVKTVKSAFADFVYVPRHDLEGEAAENPSPEDYAWYALGDEIALRIVDLTEGAEWMMHMLKEKDLPLIGAFTVVSLEDKYTERREEHEGLGHVVGTMRVNWFQYANTYVEAYAGE